MNTKTLLTIGKVVVAAIASAVVFEGGYVAANVTADDINESAKIVDRKFAKPVEVKKHWYSKPETIYISKFTGKVVK